MDGPPFPPGGQRLWELFIDLDQERGMSPVGTPLLLTARDIEPWCRLFGHRLNTWETRTLREIDRAYRLGPPKSLDEDRD